MNAYTNYIEIENLSSILDNKYRNSKILNVLSTNEVKEIFETMNNKMKQIYLNIDFNDVYYNMDDLQDLYYYKIEELEVE